MKKFITGLFFVLSSVLLVGCGSSPEQTYVDALEPALEEIDVMASVLNTFGDNLLDENFNEATTTLLELQDAVDAIQLPSYAWVNDSLITVDDSLRTVVDQTNAMIATIEPVIVKFAENDTMEASAEDTVALEKSEALTKTISEAIDTAWAAMDAYEASVQ